MRGCHVSCRDFGMRGRVFPPCDTGANRVCRLAFHPLRDNAGEIRDAGNQRGWRPQHSSENRWDRSCLGFVMYAGIVRKKPARQMETRMSIDQSADSDAFRDFEHAGWESNVSEYEAAFARLTSQAVAPLLDAAFVRHGIRLLDVATGPGYVAAVAAARGARVMGIDFSAPMVARARSANPAVEFQEGDAEALAFSDGTFDAVVMNFGILHLARPEKAMAEAARVLRPEGRFAFTVWAKSDEAVGFGIILNAIQSHGNPAVQLPQGPPFFRFSDPAECDRVLREAGFVDVSVRRVPQIWRFEAPGDLFDAIYNGGVRMKAVLRAQSGEALQAIRTAAHEATKNYFQNGIIEIPMPSILASGSKPK